MPLRICVYQDCDHVRGFGICTVLVERDEALMTWIAQVTTWERPTAAAALDVVSTVADAAHLTQPPSNSHTSDYSEGSDTDASRQPHATVIPTFPS